MILVSRIVRAILRHSVIKDELHLSYYQFSPIRSVSLDATTFHIERRPNISEDNDGGTCTMSLVVIAQYLSLVLSLSLSHHCVY